MNRVWSGHAIILVSLGLVCVAVGSEEAATDSAAREIVARALARATNVNAQSDSVRHAYSRHTTVEELDSKGRTRKTTEKLFEAEQFAGIPYARLVQLNGKPVAIEQSRKESEQNRQLRDGVTQQKSGRPDRRSSLLTADIAARFSFRLEGRDWIAGRPAYVLRFQPNPAADAAGGGMTDRLFAAVSGTLWVDEADHEVARVDANLGQRIKLWAGFLGALDKFNLTLTRSRFEDGTWYNKSSRVAVEGRRLWDTMRYRISDEASGFRRVD
jgi:hypothetical protein